MNLSRNTKRVNFGGDNRKEFRAQTQAMEMAEFKHEHDMSENVMLMESGINAHQGEVLQALGHPLFRELN